MDSVEEVIDEAVKEWMSNFEAQLGLGDLSSSITKTSSSVTELGLSASIQRIVTWLREVPTSRPGRVHYILDEQPEYYFGYLEKSEYSTLTVQAIWGTIAVMLPLFFLTRFFFPSLRTHRRGSAWILTWYSAVALFSMAMLEVGRIRTPIFEWAGLAQLAREANHASILTRRIEPATAVLAEWTTGLVNKSSISPTNGSVLTSLQTLVYQVAAELTDLARVALKGVENCPLFSSAPLAAPLDTPLIASSVSSPYLSSWLGSHSQRWLLSLENFPHQARVSAIAAGFFAGYTIVDLSVAQIYYSEYLDPLSGYAHHIFYSWLALTMVTLDRPELFLIASGLMEFSTLFLGIGHMFPCLRNDILFATTFFLVRIVLCGAMLHEFMYNHPVPLIARVSMLIALLLHTFWWYKFVQQQRRLARLCKLRRLGKDNQSQQQHGVDDDDFPLVGRSTSIHPRPVMTTSLGSPTTILLRTKPQDRHKPKAKVIL